MALFKQWQDLKKQITGEVSFDEVAGKLVGAATEANALEV